MEAPVNNSLQQFKNLVGTKFQLYNSLFTSLPFHRVEKTGIFLSLFLLHCEEGYAKGNSPQEIMDSFFLSIPLIQRKSNGPTSCSALYNMQSDR